MVRVTVALKRASAITILSSFGVPHLISVGCSWIGKELGDETGEKRDTCVATKQ